MKRIVFVVALLAISLVVVLNLNGNITGKYSYPIRSCTDSDGGKNAEVAGVVEARGLSSVKIQKYADTCRDKRTLVEHYCEYDEHLKETRPCKDECKDGACVPLYETGPMAK